jgi:sugar lactone lactonase YvrE
LTIGEKGVSKSDETHLGAPNGIAFFPNGDFILADGTINRRIVRFSKDGKFISQFGKEGTGPGEIGATHSVAVDAKQRIYVADWQAGFKPGTPPSVGRIQIFDVNGKLLDIWPNIPRPSSIAVSTDQRYVWVTDDTFNKVLQFDMDGHLLQSWGTFGGQPGNLWGPHDLSVDSEGSLYVAEIYNGRVQKFRPRKGVDPTNLVGLLFKERVQ